LYAGDHNDAVLPNLDGEKIPLGQTWVKGWLGIPGPDCTNTLFLKESLVGPYLGNNLEIWRCPINRNPIVVGIAMPRCRTISLNCFMGSPIDRPNTASYRRISDIIRPGPSDALTFMEEKIETINDGSFGVQWDFDAKKPAQWILRDKPAVVHRKGGVMTYADGHVEIKRWIDSRTVDAPRNDAPMPNNQDILWIQNHATWRE
jgi:prepilin-type processing-associated H-X9-DG protein